MSDAIISIKDLTKIYDGHSAVDQLSLSIRKGEVFGLLGPNGAGKSTTILMLLGLVEPTEGTIRVNNIDPITKPIEVKKQVGYLPDDLGFYQQMTGMENLLYTASLNGIDRKTAKDRAEELFHLVGLDGAQDKRAGTYSRGMKQRLGLADMLMKNPEMIILDEPTLGIDPEGVRETLQLIKSLNEEEDITVLLSSHHLHQVQQICDRVGIFVDGKLLAKGQIEELASQLFFEGAYVVNVEANPITEELIHEIEALEDVSQIKQTDKNALEVYSNKNITPLIAQKIIEKDAELIYIQKKDYGLDEIYHRYFEGSVAN